jgi:type IV secretion system protein VirB8
MDHDNSLGRKEDLALDSWASSGVDLAERSETRAWIVASVAAAIALCEAIALVWLMPLKETRPYTLLVDRQTGHVQGLDPIAAETISADAALTKSFLVQYVIARESFFRETIEEDYRKVSLWTGGDERARYLAAMAAGDGRNRLESLPSGATIKVEIRSVSSLSTDTSMVRFTTVRTDRGSQAQEPQYWAAIISYRFSRSEMSEADRFTNPLGFLVTRYRKDAERLPEVDLGAGESPQAPSVSVGPQLQEQPQ